MILPKQSVGDAVSSDQRLYNAEPKPRYRLLNMQDTIQEGDCYLEDDAETWTPVPESYVGREFNARSLSRSVLRRKVV